MPHGLAVAAMIAGHGRLDHARAARFGPLGDAERRVARVRPDVQDGHRDVMRVRA